MEVFLGSITLVSFNFAPVGYSLCNGQVLPISTNTALFALMGTFYGGNGTNNFQLPDLRGRIPIHQGQGAGLSPYTIGQVGGIESETLAIGQMPAHNHTMNIYHGPGNVSTPAANTSFFGGGVPTGSGPNASQLNSYTATAPDTVLGTATIGNSGGSQPFSVLQPYLCMTYIIAMQGVFPARN
jgi:microcystin-dependent protein